MLTEISGSVYRSIYTYTYHYTKRSTHLYPSIYIYNLAFLVAMRDATSMCLNLEIVYVHQYLSMQIYVFTHSNRTENTPLKTN